MARPSRLLFLVPLLLAPGCVPWSGSSSDGTPCERACDNALNAHCSFETREQCVKGCEDSGEATRSKPDYCQQAYEEYIGCLAEMTEVTCAFKGIDPAHCRPAMDHYSNYCLANLTPEEPCREPPALLNLLCADTPATRRPRVCPGTVEPGCVMGGDDGFKDVYCCPGDPIAGPDAGPGPDAGARPDGGGQAPDAAQPGPDAGAQDAGLSPDAGTAPADAGAPPPPDFSAEIKACAHALACGGYGAPPSLVESLSNCVFGLARANEPRWYLVPGVDAWHLWNCGQGAGSCRQFALCMNLQHDEAYCAAHPGPSCDGTRAVNCSSTTAPADDAIDCATGANTCTVLDGRAQCLVAQSCPQPGACTSTSSYWKCQDGTAVQATGLWCFDGTACQFSALADNPLCVGTTACSGANRCEGSVFVECANMAEFSFERRTDCALLKGHACSATGCVLANPECFAHTDSCVGDVFQGCVVGRPVAYDCKANGFARCGQNARGRWSCLY